MKEAASFSWDRFAACPVIGILRGFSGSEVERLVEIVAANGLTSLEITMNTPNAAALIRSARQVARGRLNIGAGTVTSVSTLEAALEAGAGFIVTPALQRDVIRRCRDRGIPVVPGAFSPTEVAMAWELGADLVKVFPSDQGGPEFVRHLKEELPMVRLVPTGGVQLGSLSAYRLAGADGYGVGSPLFDRKRISAGDWDWVRQQCAAWSAALAPDEHSGEPEGE